jgi:signal transduction histidine kinase
MPHGISKEAQAEMRHFSHELRNMLSAIYTYAQVLELTLEKNNMKKETDIAHSIVDSVKDMEALIKEELDLPTS